jgi:HPt (histidine-containing phosphotransfer) domain-containing protein
MSGDAVLDAAALDRLRDLNEEGGPDLVVEVLTLFLDDAPARVEVVDATLAAGDAPGLERAAHGLKGAAANIGARRLVAVCHQLERLGAGGLLPDAAPGVAALRAEFETLRAEIQRVLRS